MNTIKMANEAAREVCELLGVDHRNVSGVVIRLDAGQVAVAEISMVITREQWAQIGAAGKQVPE